MQSRMILALVLLLALPANDVFAQAAALIGVMYAEGTQRGERAQIILENRSDGTFQRQIRKINDCAHPEDWREAGMWTYDNGILTFVTTSSHENPMYDKSPFRVKFIDQNHFSLLDEETLALWLFTKVSPSFEMPLTGGCVS